MKPASRRLPTRLLVLFGLILLASQAVFFLYSLRHPAAEAPPPWADSRHDVRDAPPLMQTVSHEHDTTAQRRFTATKPTQTAAFPEVGLAAAAAQPTYRAATKKEPFRRLGARFDEI